MIPVSPEFVKALNAMMRGDLDSWSADWFWVLIVSTAIVVIGLLAELPEVWAEVLRPAWNWARNFWNTKIRVEEFDGWETVCPELRTFALAELTKGWKFFIETTALLGWVLVAVGVAGEGVAEYFVNDAETNLRAFDQAVLAETQQSANSAATASSLANTFSDKAIAASSNALNLASGARREADSFEKDILSAKTLAADAESHLADALQRAASAEEESAKLKKRFSDRTLDDTQARSIAAKIRPFAGQEFDVTPYWDLPESFKIADRLAGVMNSPYAGWKYIKPTQSAMLLGGVSGVQVWIHPAAPDSVKNAAAALVSALNAESITAYIKEQNPKNPIQLEIHLSVGTKE